VLPQQARALKKAGGSGKVPDLISEIEKTAKLVNEFTRLVVRLGAQHSKAAMLVPPVPVTTLSGFQDWPEWADPRLCRSYGFENLDGVLTPIESHDPVSDKVSNATRDCICNNWKRLPKSMERGAKILRAVSEMSIFGRTREELGLSDAGWEDLAKQTYERFVGEPAPTPSHAWLSPIKGSARNIPRPCEDEGEWADQHQDYISSLDGGIIRPRRIGPFREIQGGYTDIRSAFLAEDLRVCELKPKFCSMVVGLAKMTKAGIFPAGISNGPATDPSVRDKVKSWWVGGFFLLEQLRLVLIELAQELNLDETVILNSAVQSAPLDSFDPSSGSVKPLPPGTYRLMTASPPENVAMQLFLDGNAWRYLQLQSNEVYKDQVSWFSDDAQTVTCGTPPINWKPTHIGKDKKSKGVTIAAPATTVAKRASPTPKPTVSLPVQPASKPPSRSPSPPQKAVSPPAISPSVPFLGTVTVLPEEPKVVQPVKPKKASLVNSLPDSPKGPGVLGTGLDLYRHSPPPSAFTPVPSVSNSLLGDNMANLLVMIERLTKQMEQQGKMLLSLEKSNVNLLQENEALKEALGLKEDVKPSGGTWTTVPPPRRPHDGSPYQSRRALSPGGSGSVAAANAVVPKPAVPKVEPTKPPTPAATYAAAVSGGLVPAPNVGTSKVLTDAQKDRKAKKRAKALANRQAKILAGDDPMVECVRCAQSIRTSHLPLHLATCQQFVHRPSTVVVAPGTKVLGVPTGVRFGLNKDQVLSVREALGLPIRKPGDVTETYVSTPPWALQLYTLYGASVLPKLKGLDTEDKRKQFKKDFLPQLNTVTAVNALNEQWKAVKAQHKDVELKQNGTDAEKALYRAFQPIRARADLLNKRFGDQKGLQIPKDPSAKSKDKAKGGKKGGKGRKGKGGKPKKAAAVPIVALPVQPAAVDPFVAAMAPMGAMVEMFAKLMAVMRPAAP